MLVIFRKVCIEEIDNGATNPQPPSLKIYSTVTDLDGIKKSPPFVSRHEFQWKAGRIIKGIRFLLPAVGADMLLKITVSIEEADTDERNSQVACRLGVIARENAESARVNRKRFVEAKLCTEIGDRVGQLHIAVGDPSVIGLHVRFEFLQNATDLLLEFRILQSRSQFRMRYLAQNFNGGMIRALPGQRRELGKNFLGLGVPGPPKISCECVQALCKRFVTAVAYQGSLK